MTKLEWLESPKCRAISESWIDRVHAAPAARLAPDQHRASPRAGVDQGHSGQPLTFIFALEACLFSELPLTRCSFTRRDFTCLFRTSVALCALFKRFRYFSEDFEEPFPLKSSVSIHEASFALMRKGLK